MQKPRGKTERNATSANLSGVMCAWCVVFVSVWSLCRVVWCDVVSVSCCVVSVSCLCRVVWCGVCAVFVSVSCGVVFVCVVSCGVCVVWCVCVCVVLC